MSPKPHACLAVLAISLSALQAADSAGRIADLAQAVVDRGDVPGVVVGISSPGTAPVIIARGVSDLSTGASMSAANFQRIGSITKSFTVTRILQLADEGRLSLDDPISKYVPGLRNGNATLRQLADMTSGIFNYTEDKPFILDFAFHPTKPWTEAQLVAVANQHAPYFKPGAAWHYSNTNTVLLGMVVEHVTGGSLRAQITRHLLRPIHLDETFYPTGVDLPSPFSHGYATLDDEQGPIDVSRSSPSGSAGSGAMISTMSDLFRWGRALARGSLVSRRAQLARLQMVDSSSGVGPYYDRYGLGLGRINGWIGHTADLLGYQSLVMHNLVTNQTVVIFVNASNPAHVPTDLFRKITSLLPTAVPARPTTLRVTGVGATRVISSPTVTLRGKSDSEAGILLVEYSANGIHSRPVRGTRLWRAKIPLQPGRNVITLRAVDYLGRRSSPQRLVIVRN